MEDFPDINTMHNCAFHVQRNYSSRGTPVRYELLGQHTYLDASSTMYQHSRSRHFSDEYLNECNSAFVSQPDLFSQFASLVVCL